MEKYEAAVRDFQEAMEQAEMEGSTADVKALRDELRKAEVALKRSKTKDYYKILGMLLKKLINLNSILALVGLAKDCNDADIKKAYRRESLKHHPDKVRTSDILIIGWLIRWVFRAEMKRSSS